MKFSKVMHGGNNEYFRLMVIFILFILVKSLLSLKFPSPWIFADETAYAETARNVLGGQLFSNLKYCQTYPPGYSIILSVAYLFSDDMVVIYRIMLFINCIITSSIIFPSYFILNKFCNRHTSFLGSVTITALPSTVLYTFVLMSENLFIPLFMFSGWFLLESYSKNRKLYDFLAGFSIFSLFLTRTMGVAMIVGFLISLTYYILMLSRHSKISTILIDRLILVVSFALPMTCWLEYKSKNVILGYNSAQYSDVFLGMFRDIHIFESFLSLLLHEFEFLIISSYFIIFFMACLFIFNEFKGFKTQLFRNRKLQNHPDIGVNLSLTSFLVYIMVSSLILISITITHMYIALKDGNLQYLIFGRYIDPIVPFIFLLGIIEIDRIYSIRYKLDKSKMATFICMYVTLVTLFNFTFPHSYYKFSNIFSIYYIQSLKSTIPIGMFIGIFLLIIIVVFYILIRIRRSRNTLFLFIILISLTASIYPIQTQLNNSLYASRVSPIGIYINEHLEDDKLVLADRFDESPLIWFSTTFWMNGYLTHHSINNGLSDIQLNNVKYIISSKLLPYQPVICSMGYKLYEIDNTQKEQIIVPPVVIDIGLNDDCIIENFHGAEKQAFRWTRDSSKILIPYHPDLGPMKLDIETGGYRPSDNPANIEWYINDNKIGQDIKPAGDHIYSFVVPDRWLNQNYQILNIVSNTWKPSDYGAHDNRNLGIIVDWVKVDTIESNNGVISLSDGWHGLEYWNNTPSRWIENDATLIIESKENRTAELSFQAISFYNPRTLDIYMNNDLEITAEICNTNFVVVEKKVNLNSGSNIIRFHARDGCERPCDYPSLNNLDNRCLSIACQNINLSYYDEDIK